MAEYLIYGDTLRSPAMRHEVPLGIGDPFLYLETDGRRVVVTNPLEDDRIAEAAPDLERLLADELGLDELIAQGLQREVVYREVFARAVDRVGIRAAVVPPEFPYIKLHPDERTAQFRRFRDSLKDRPGFKWVEDMYARHRGTSGEVAEA